MITKIRLIPKKEKEEDITLKESIKHLNRIDKDINRFKKEINSIPSNEVLSILSGIVTKIINYKFKIKKAYTKKELIDALSGVKSYHLIQEVLLHIYSRLYHLKFSGEGSTDKNELLQIIEQAKIINKLELIYLYDNHNNKRTDKNLVNLYNLCLKRFDYLNKGELEKANMAAKLIKRKEGKLSKPKKRGIAKNTAKRYSVILKKSFQTLRVKSHELWKKDYPQLLGSIERAVELNIKENIKKISLHIPKIKCNIEEEFNNLLAILEQDIYNKNISRAKAHYKGLIKLYLIIRKTNIQTSRKQQYYEKIKKIYYNLVDVIIEYKKEKQKTVPLVLATLVIIAVFGFFISTDIEFKSPMSLMEQVGYQEGHQDIKPRLDTISGFVIYEGNTKQRLAEQPEEQTKPKAISGFVIYEENTKPKPIELSEHKPSIITGFIIYEEDNETNESTGEENEIPGDSPGILGLPHILGAGINTPSFITITNEYKFNLTEDEASNILVQGHDNGDVPPDYPLNFSFLVLDLNKEIFGVMNNTIENNNDTSGWINFTPTEEYVYDSNTNIGEYTVTIVLTDKASYSTTVFVIFNISNINDVPIINNSSPSDSTPTVDENSQITFSYDNDTSDPDLIHPDTDNLTTKWEINGVLNNTNVSWTYYPDYCDSGTYNISLNITDTGSLSDNLTWQLTVTNINRKPANNKTFANITWAEGTNLTDNLTLTQYFNDSDNIFCSGINKDNITYGYETISVTSKINILHEINVSISNSTSLVNFTHSDSDWYGIQVIRLYANDGYDITYGNNITLNITNIADAPYFNPTPADQNLTVDNEFSYDINATDPDNDTLIFTSNVTILGGSINSSTGIITWTPNSSQIKAHYINITVNDTELTDSQLIMLNVSGNEAPVMNAIEDQTITEVTEFLLNVSASDPNTAQNLTFNVSVQNLTSADNSTINIEIQKLNLSAATLSFTPTHAHVGNYSVTVNVTDPYNLSDNTTFNLNITGVNQAPTIDTIYPYGTPLSGITVFAFNDTSIFPNSITSINATENTTMLFNSTTSDEEGDPLRCLWYFDDTLEENNSCNATPHWSYVINFTQSGTKNITLIVDDQENNTESFTWNVTVADVNREPFFGTRILTTYSDFDSSTLNGTNITLELGNITLNKTGQNYTNGTYLSPAINFNSKYIYNRTNITTISWIESKPNGTNISFRVKVAATEGDLSSANWTNYSTDAGGANILEGGGGYVQFEINMTTENQSITPRVEKITINYKIKDSNIDGNFQAWIDLDNFFSDLDDNTVFNYTYQDISSASALGITINTDGTVSFKPTESGTAVFRFIANDSKNIAYSNDISIGIELSAGVTLVRTGSGSGGGGGSRTKIRIITQKEPTYLHLISVDPVRAESEKTFIVPVTLNNTANISLNEIYMSATSDRSDISFRFSKDYIKEIISNEYTKLDLFIDQEDIIADPYSVKVIANVTTQGIYDTSIVNINQMANISQKVTLVMDMLKLNPVCRELGEVVVKAQQNLREGKYQEADSLLTETIEGCNYLIASLESGKELASKKSLVLKQKTIYLLIGAFIVVMSMLYYMPHVVTMIKHPELLKRRKIGRIKKNKVI